MKEWEVWMGTWQEEEEEWRRLCKRFSSTVALSLKASISEGVLIEESILSMAKT